MRFSTSVAAVAAAAGVASAQNATSNSTGSVCDKYTAALLGSNTAANQYTLLKYLVNTVVIGDALAKPMIPNVTFPTNVKVPGILANGTVNGTAVNLLPYFNGGLASSNRGGNAGVAVNFLDDGGAAPLTQNMPANGTSSNQYRLLTHLYQYFGSLLGCSQQGQMGFSTYMGGSSQYNVHKFMDLNAAQNTYFIQQVGLAAASFGVSEADINTVATALSGLFNVRCAAATTVIPSQGAQLQSICVANTCPLAMNNTCSAYASNTTAPGVANSTLAQGQGNASSTATASAANGGSPTSSATAGASSGAAAKNVVLGGAAGVLAAAAYFL